MTRSNSGLKTPSDLTSLTYRSRAATPLTPVALRGLERASQTRNRSEGLSGLAVYDDGRFFQWLEGPKEALTRVWESIRQDPRHTDIADVTVRSTPSRVFDGWDMTLAIRGDKRVSGRSRPAPLLSLVPTLDPLLANVVEEAIVGWGKDASAAPVIPILPVLVEALVVPQILAKHGKVRRFLPPVSPVAARLSRLLLDDARPAGKVLRRLYANAGSLASLCATVIEPAARCIGDMWLADDCTQLAMTLALCRLQTIVRQMTAESTPVTVGLPVVLVAPQPGEGHLLGACLDAELLWQAGWDTHREFPTTNQDLDTLVSEMWFDVLDLSLSPALERGDALALMTETIAGARAASLNQELTVVVGGRAFYEQCERSASVGADASTSSALQVVLTATAARAATLTKVAQRSLLVTSS